MFHESRYILWNQEVRDFDISIWHQNCSSFALTDSTLSKTSGRSQNTLLHVTDRNTQTRIYGVNGRTERYYMIRIVSSGLRVMVPQSNADSVGLRAVIRSNDASKVLGFLEKGKLNSHHDWKHRFKENSERMRTGSLLEVAVVLKSLVSLSRSKPLSFREKKMLERAKYLLVSEMATARNTTSESAEGLVVKSLAKAKLQFPLMTEKFE